MTLVRKFAAALEDSPFFGRPLFLFSVIFLVLLFLFQINTVAAPVFIVTAVVFLAVSLFSRKERIKKKTVLAATFAVAVMVAALRCVPVWIEKGAAEAIEGQTVNVSARVEKIYWEENYGGKYFVKVKEIDGKKADFFATLTLDGTYGLSVYDLLTFTATAVAPTPENITAGKLILRSEKHFADFGDVSLESISPPEKNAGYALFRLRKSIADRFDALLDTQSAGFAKAVFIGDKSGLPGTLKRDMSALGISHILAVSGLHTSVIASFVMLLVDKLRGGRKATALTVSAAGIVYVFIAGLSYSVARAVIMLIMSVIPFFFGRKGDSLTALGMSGIVICLISPEAVLSVGFLLSFFASLGIVLCAASVEKRTYSAFSASRAGDMKRAFGLARKFLSALTVSVSASFFTVPVIALYYGEISIIAVLVNIVAIPCASVQVVLALILLFVGDVPVVGRLLSASFEGVYYFLKRFSSLVAGNFRTSVSLGYPFFTVVCILFVSVLIFFRLRRKRDPALLFIPFLVCALVFTGCFQTVKALTSDRAEIVYSVKKNSEGFVLASGDKIMYVDAGDGSKEFQFYSTENAFGEYRKTRLDGYMLTHYHVRHIGTLRSLLSETYVGTVFLPYPETEEEKSIYKSIMLFAGDENIVTYRRGTELTFGNIRIGTVPYSVTERSGHPVIALKFSFTGADGTEKAMTFLGSSVGESDVFAEAERLSVGVGLFVVGRHGPVTKEDLPFFGIPEGAEVWLSPYEDSDETVLFPGCVYRTLCQNGDAPAVKKFILN